MNKLLRILMFCTGLAIGSLAIFSSSWAQDAIVGNVNAGSKKVAMCIGCHEIQGYKTAYPVVYHVPKIAGQYDEYLAAALQAYANGERKHPSMVGIAGSLTQQDIADVAAFYAAQGQKEKDEASSNHTPPAPPSSQVQAFLEAGSCAACHGADFTKGLGPTYPKLAGQYADSLYNAMRSYVAGDKNATWGRVNPIMSGALLGAKDALNLNDREFNATLRATSDYLASLPGTIYTVPEKPFR